MMQNNSFALVMTLAIFGFMPRSSQSMALKSSFQEHCVNATCSYETMDPMYFSTTSRYKAHLQPVDWKNSKIKRACSCTYFCAFYGDCCADALEESKKEVAEMLGAESWHQVVEIRRRLNPACIELYIESTQSLKAERSIDVQMAEECNDCYVDEITDYTGSNRTEIEERLPVYHEDVGIVFSNMKCATMCYPDTIDIKKLRALPFSVECNGSVRLDDNSHILEEQQVTCLYSINITMKLAGQLAFCVPTVKDYEMQKQFFCQNFNMTGRKFQPCDGDTLSGVPANLARIRNEIYVICSKNESELAAQCGQDVTKVTVDKNTSFSIGEVTQPYYPQDDYAACIPEGGHLKYTWSNFFDMAESSFGLHESDFSFRYMFDMFKLSEVEDALDKKYEQIFNVCRSDRNEVFIERWHKCVKRRKTPSFAFARTQPEDGEVTRQVRDWLDFGLDFFEPNGTKWFPIREPSFQLDSECYRLNFITGHVLVSELCLCDAFKVSEHNKVVQVRDDFMPKEDDVLSFVGAISIWVSIFFLVAAVVIPAVFSKLRNRATKVTMVLSILLCTGMVLVLVNVYTNISISRRIARKFLTFEDVCLKSPYWHLIACSSIGALLHFCYLSSLFLASALYIDLLHSVRTMRTVQNFGGDVSLESSTRFYLLTGASCAIPFLIVVTAVIIDQVLPDSELAPRYAEYVCWISDPYALMVFFVCPVVLVLVTDVVLFLLIAHHIRVNSFKSSSKQTDSKSTSTPSSSLADYPARTTNQRSTLRIYIKMALMMGLTSIIGCVAPVVPDEYNLRLFIWYSFVILNGLQGVFIFYANVTNNRTRQVLRSSWRRALNTGAANSLRLVNTNGHESRSNPALNNINLPAALNSSSLASV